MLTAVNGCLGPVASLYPPRANETTTTVWIIGHRIHTGIVVRRADVPPAIWPESDDFRGATYLEVGWGDRDYFQAPRGTLALALRASVASRGSVLHIAGFDLPVEEFFPQSDLVEVALTTRGFDALSATIPAAAAQELRTRRFPAIVLWLPRTMGMTK